MPSLLKRYTFLCFFVLLYHNTVPYFYVYEFARFGKTEKEEKYIFLSEAALNNNWNFIEGDINN